MVLEGRVDIEELMSGDKLLYIKVTDVDEMYKEGFSTDEFFIRAFYDADAGKLSLCSGAKNKYLCYRKKHWIEFVPDENMTSEILKLCADVVN